MESDHGEVVAQLHAAFPKHPIQSDGTFDPWGATYLDAAPYMQHLQGKSWDKLDRAYIIRRSDALGFLGTRSLIAVLPVYLRALVEDGESSPAAEMLMLILNKPPATKTTGISAARFDALVAALTESQRTAVASALRAFADTNPEGSLGRAARAALDAHWNADLPPGA